MLYDLCVYESNDRTTKKKKKKKKMMMMQKWHFYENTILENSKIMCIDGVSLSDHQVPVAGSSLPPPL